MPLEKHSMGSDRRTAPRHAAEGEVNLRPDGLMSTAVRGQMLDVASSGFRARHDSPALMSGQIVEFAFNGAEGRARVVWTRISGGHVESGFLILA